MKCVWRRGVSVVLLTAVLCIFAPAVRATTWQNASIGNWFIASNWTLGVPASNTDAIVQNGGVALLFDPGANAAGLFLGINGQSGGLSISNGGTLAQTGGAFLGRNTKSTGTVTVWGANSAWSAGTLRLGRTTDPAGAGAGFLRVENDRSARTVESQLAWGSASSGSATVTGGGYWEIVSTLDVGFRGSGSLTVSAGGFVTGATGANIAPFAGSTGTATVTGNGSAGYNGGPLYIGGRDNGAGATVNGGSGSLRIQNGGYVQATELKFFNNGVLEVDNGSTTVPGLKILGGRPFPPSGGTLGDMVVGTTTAGRMEIRPGGVVWSHRSFIGISSGGNGVVLVTDSNSRWLSNGSVGSSPTSPCT